MLFVSAQVIAVSNRCQQSLSTKEEEEEEGGGGGVGKVYG